MFSAVAAFELRYQLRSPVFLVSCALFFLLAFGATTVDEIQIGSRGNVHVNAPYAILQATGLLQVFALFVLSALVSGAVVRDQETGFAAILQTTRLGRFDYLIGRYCGALAAAWLVTACVPLGILVGSWMPWLDPEKVGPNLPAYYGYALFVLSLPTLLAMSACLFALATATGSMMWSHVGATLGVVLFMTARRMLRDPSHDLLSALSDPFGISPVELATRYWTAAERNTLLPPLAGWWLVNRLLWIAFGLALLALAYARLGRRGRAGTAPRAGQDRPGRSPSGVPASGPSHLHPSRSGPLPTRPLIRGQAGRRALQAQFLTLLRMELGFLLGSPSFYVLLAIGLLNTVGGLLGVSEVRGVAYLPVTRALIDMLQGSFAFVTVLVAVYYGGELVWRDRERHIDEIIDASPLGGWVQLLPKLLAISLVLLAMLSAAVLESVAFQLLHGYQHIEWLHYLDWFLLPTGIAAIQLAVLSVVVQVLVPSKPAGWAVMLVYIVASVALGAIGFEHKLYSYADTAEVPLSDLNGTGLFWIGRAWHQLYWSWVAALLLVVAHVLWPRGSDRRLRPRLRAAAGRLQGKAGWVAGACTLGVLASGLWIYDNTDLRNPYQTRPDRERRMADYERTLIAYEQLPEPTVSAVDLDVELYPREARAETRGSYLIENRSSAPIDTVHVQWHLDLRRSAIEIPGARLEREFPGLHHQVWRLDPALQPGEQRTVRFSDTWSEPGFVNSRPQTRVVPNGSFLDTTQITPVFGVPRDHMLQERAKRHKYGLSDELRPPRLEDSAANAFSAARHDSGWIRASLRLTTDADQVPVAPGATVSDTVHEGRRTLVTRSEAPLLNFFSLQSARYAVSSEPWPSPDGRTVTLQVYHHPDHRWNVPRMFTAMKASLELFSREFSPFQFGQARIIEFPAFEVFAQSFAGTVPFSEAIGFVQDFDPAQAAERIDLVTFVTAHEIAHQWWGHQLMSADKQGATMLIETLAQYSALLVMEQLYGKAQMRKFLKFELDSYLRNRGGELVEELPLARVEDQPYIHYRKGALVMWRLKEVLGAQVVNRALRRMLAAHAFRAAPWPDTREFLQDLREEAGPGHDLLIGDLFERITLYDLKASDAHAERRPDGRYTLRFTVTAHKRYADGRGRESEAALDEELPVGAFTREPGKAGYAAAAVLADAILRVHAGSQQLTLVVDQAPRFAGIDPFNTCIDRNSEDNLTPVAMP